MVFEFLKCLQRLSIEPHRLLCQCARHCLQGGYKVLSPQSDRFKKIFWCSLIVGFADPNYWFTEQDLAFNMPTKNSFFHYFFLLITGTYLRYLP